MDPGRRALIEGRAPRSRDITSPRRDDSNRISKPQRPAGSSSSRPYRNNQSLEDEQSKKWVAEEDNFVLKQAKKKAEIRVREGRAKPIDWLAVILRVIDPDRDLLDVDEEEVQLDVVDPEGVFEDLNESQFEELENDIKSYIALETNRKNQDYWKTMQIICNDRRQKLRPLGPDERAVSSVAADVDRLLGPKTYEQLETLEVQIRAKLRSNEPIDTDYWEQLLKSLLIWKAKAKLKKVYQSVLDTRLAALKKQQQEHAEAVQKNLQELLSGPTPVIEEGSVGQDTVVAQTSLRPPHFEYSQKYDPEPLLKLRVEDKSGEIIDESDFLKKIAAERRRVIKLGYVPSRQSIPEKSTVNSTSKPSSSVSTAPPGTQRFSAMPTEDFSQATTALYEREVARGVNENEEIFSAEESLATTSAPQWADKYRPRKPRYFNRVQMGYEWNKYNQTHYDHDNPPPKVVQGYKFNIFYPDLIDKSKAPTFRIIREHGRKRGESFAPAGEEDTCLIRFIAGPPYEDIAFRIVDKEWDYSAKRDRGFRSSFDKFKKVSKIAKVSCSSCPADLSFSRFITGSDDRLFFGVWEVLISKSSASRLLTKFSCPRSFHVCCVLR
ncbi:cactin protein [Rutstroemia sp. NJR-2017a BBW]|nr:cactin protein [Rutstroemia sp. NJR-2017a BBW]